MIGLALRWLGRYLGPRLRYGIRRNLLTRPPPDTLARILTP